MSGALQLSLRYHRSCRKLLGPCASSLSPSSRNEAACHSNAVQSALVQRFLRPWQRAGTANLRRDSGTRPAPPDAAAADKTTTHGGGSPTLLGLRNPRGGARDTATGAAGLRPIPRPTFLGVMLIFGGYSWASARTV